MIAEKVLLAEIKGLDGHDPFTYLSKKRPVPPNERENSTLQSNPLWKLRQLEILDGQPIKESEILNIDPIELKDIYHNDTRIMDPVDHDAYNALNT